MIRPRWEWTWENEAGDDVAAPSPVFTTQYDAEEWLGEHWRDPAAAGAVRARLLHEGGQATPTVELRIP